MPRPTLPSSQLVGQWAILIAASAALSGLLGLARLPAALLLGPMLAGIACGVAGFRPRVPRPVFQGAQAVLGLLVGHAITGSIVATVVANGPLMVLVVLVTVAAGALVGWVLTRMRVLPGTTAAWGSSPGAAAAMTAMAEAHGADARYVAFMQYTRMACVALAATLVARLWAEPGPAPAAPPDLGALVAIPEFLASLVIGAAGVALGLWLRLPSGALIGPMVLGAVLHATGVVAFALPSWLLVLAYAGIGWYVGLRFTRETVRASLRALPAILAATFAMIALCGLWAWLLTRILAIDPLTAYLATSPGGLDTVAIIALGTGADLSFILAAQVLRLFVVLLTGPLIARLIARGAPEGEPRV